MSSPNPPHDVWSRLRAYGEEFPVPYPEHRRWYGRHVRDGVIYADTVVDDLGDEAATPYLRFPPATEEQLRATEERLGFPLPPDLRRLYAEVANGGLELGLVQVFHGAIGGCGEYAMARNDGRTIEELTSDSGWRLHPRIEEALMRHPGRYIVVDSLPEGFIWIGEDSDISLEIDGMTGHVYYTEGWGYLPDAPPERVPGPFDLLSIEAVVPSLSVWFERWLDGRRDPPGERGPLLPEMVETADLPDPDVVWRGLCRFGQGWNLEYEDTDLAHDAAHAIYWTYVEDAGREDDAYEDNPEG